MSPLFDAIFIDGGHLYYQALEDIRNAATLVKPGTNDVYNAWRHAIGMGLVKPFPDTCRNAGL
eukprot:CAMPEP_0114369458 /NCGR_PEP_ID=MMETSP0101-20121206/31689_1 /TAXON_ID=38822 ORGANISM="Pteridomonas danica, Strain PT" /NCGR_SAMPLE_ID=MMETSP0101 /ASSEMBLY_ACC=CAM_ASM_000211 /LENGTH=62 /DNA_ID=CAMNT_0001520325 /DNA_START=387 /DNA_END=571 /DNA_ORIENTATION=+